MRVRGYNSPQRMTFSKRLLAWIIALLCISPAHALNSWDSPSAEIAARIAALTGPGTITLSITNRSSLSNDDVAAIREGVVRALQIAGVSVRPKNAESDVRLTLSQNLQGRLWIVEVQQGSETKVDMLAVGGADAVAVAAVGPAITLHAALIYAQAEPILDIAQLGEGMQQQLFVLEPEHIKAYRQTAGNWQLAQTYDVAHQQPFPRDLRGRLAPVGEQLFDAYLPGVVCRAQLSSPGPGLIVACSDSDDPWPLGSQKAFYNSTATTSPAW